MIGRLVIGFIALLPLFSLGKVIAQENNASVTKGAFEFQTVLKSNRVEGLIARTESCWQKFYVNKSQDAAAFCFAIDYLASDFSEFISRREGSVQPEALSIQRVLSRVNSALKRLNVEQTERGKLIAGWIKLSQRAVASGQDQESSINSFDGKTAFTRAKKAILRKIPNPNTAHFGKLEQHNVVNFKGVMTAVVCGTVVFRLRPDVLSGARRFVYFLKDQSAYYDRGQPPADLDTEIVRNFCTE